MYLGGVIMFIKNIPNILTSIRIILTPFIIYLSYIDNIIGALILIFIASISDMFDGMIARKYNLTSDFGAKLDTISDKLFAGCLVISLIIKNKLFILCLIGEIMIATINIISYFKKFNPKTKYIGKIKTTILFITVGLGFLSFIFPNITILVNIFIVISFILQIISSIFYLKVFTVKTSKC